MKLNCLVVVLLLFVFNLATGFSDAFAQAGGSGSTNSEVPPWEIDKQSDFEAIKAKAENGDAVAQYKLGVCYGEGKAVTKDDIEAVKWYRKAAEQNNADGQYNLGLCYANGEGVSKDEAKAAKWYRKAAEQNNATAQCLLAGCFLTGDGVTKDETEAVKWYRKAAEQNLMLAELALAYFYADGKAVPKDQVESVKWWRKLADQGSAPAQFSLGDFYYNGDGVKQDYNEAVNWYRKAAEQNLENAQYSLGFCYAKGKGVMKNDAEAVKWYRKAAEQGVVKAQVLLGLAYAQSIFGTNFDGLGLQQDYRQAVKWFSRAANQGDAAAQAALGACYRDGQGVPKNRVEAYKWLNLAAAQNSPGSAGLRDSLGRRMTPEEIAKAEQLSADFVALKGKSNSTSDNSTSPENPTATGSGFFITDNGYLISNYHVVKDAAKVRLVTSAGLIDAKVVQVDAANDLALLKAEGKFSPLPISSSRSAQLGGTVATVGFPNIGMQGFAPKLAKGEIASLSGAGDDPRYFQISVPVQPGNSGGALVDEHGNVVGIVSAKLSARVALAESGALPENVNYAVKSSFLLSFLESVPAVSAKLKEPITADRKFADVVKSAQDAAVLVLVY